MVLSCPSCHPPWLLLVGWLVWFGCPIKCCNFLQLVFLVFLPCFEITARNDQSITLGHWPSNTGWLLWLPLVAELMTFQTLWAGVYLSVFSMFYLQFIPNPQSQYLTSVCHQCTILYTSLGFNLYNALSASHIPFPGNYTCRMSSAWLCRAAQFLSAVLSHSSSPLLNQLIMDAALLSWHCWFQLVLLQWFWHSCCKISCCSQ